MTGPRHDLEPAVTNRELRRGEGGQRARGGFDLARELLRVGAGGFGGGLGLGQRAAGDVAGVDRPVQRAVGGRRAPAQGVEVALGGGAGACPLAPLLLLS